MRHYLKITFFLWLLVITIFSVLPHKDKNSEIKDLVKSYQLTPSGFFQHVAAYFIASFLGCLAYRKDGLWFLLFVGTILFIFSNALEIIQIFLPYRTFNIYDILANLSGIGFCLGLFAILSYGAWRMEHDVAKVQNY